MDIILFPDIDSSSAVDGNTVYYGRGLVLGLDDSNKLIFDPEDTREYVKSVFLKILLTRKGSVVSNPLEGTLLLKMLDSPMNTEQFDSASIMAIMDAEQQVKQLQKPNRAIDILKKFADVTLAKVSVESTSFEDSKISIKLIFTDNTTSRVTLIGRLQP
jgi:hypothetical protein